MSDELAKDGQQDSCGCQNEGFGDLLKFTLPGYAGGILLGAILDHFGFYLSAIGQWIVRTISGEGESILEGIFSLRKRLSGSAGTLAEAYGWGKLTGMIFPWIIDWGSRFLNLDVYGPEGFFIPYFYALSDQIGANISGFIFLHKRSNSFAGTLGTYFRNPVMLTSLGIILLAPVGLFLARTFGFSPITQKLTALETIIANLCWLPPVVGWLVERRIKSH